jgi:hypothetical protein
MDLCNLWKRDLLRSKEFQMNLDQIDKIMEILNLNSARIKKILAFFFIFLTLHGTIGFAEFIFEESMQTCMFAAFSYQSAHDYSGMQQHLIIMKKTQHQSEIFIYGFGWLAPLMWPAYLNYLQNNAAYIKSAERRLKIERNASITSLL